ncbi:MAG: ChaN family lipoprotein [Sulfuritalea sp.]|nr:ChaN family lipoprotein [Sulfuritalea sp.]
MIPEFNALLRLLIAGLSLFLTGCATGTGETWQDIHHPLSGRLWDVAAQSFIDENELHRRARPAEVLLLGETHDNPEHHRLQLEVLQVHVASGAKPALLMEQLNIDQQGAIDAALRDEKSLAPLMPGWIWKHYEPLIAFAKRTGISLRAANLQRSAIHPIVRTGFSTLAAGETRRLALEAVWNDNLQKYMSQLIEESHCGQITPQLRDGLVRAQRVRDATMADSVLGKIEEGVVFILGRGHARRDIGVPRYLEARRPGTRVLSIGFIEVNDKDLLPMNYENDSVGGIAPYDIIWFTSRTDRDDPCATFGK